MKIFLDTREILVYEKMLEMKERLQLSHPIDIQTMSLHIGDIFISTDDDKHVCIFERKTLTDFISSIKDGRYKEQSYRLLHSTQIHPHNIFYIVEGTMNQIKSPAEKKMLYGAMTSLHFFKGVSLIRTTCVSETVEHILYFAEKVAKNAKEGIFPKYENNGSGANPNNNMEKEAAPLDAGASTYTSVVKKSKKENVTPENIGVLLLSQIPHVGTKVAESIMKKYEGSIMKFLLALKDDEESAKLDGIDGADDDPFSGIKCGSMEGITFENGRKIPASTIANIRAYLLRGPPPLTI